jgi:hypothetical protein
MDEHLRRDADHHACPESSRAPVSAFAVGAAPKLTTALADISLA